MTESLKTVADIPQDLLDHYLHQSVVAVDTELHGLTLYRDQVCLIQLCDDKKNLCLVQPTPGETPPNVKKLMEAEQVLKVFHFALTDVAFLKTSLGIAVTPFACTRVMSKLIRTYTPSHSLKAVTQELLGIELDKEQQQTDWSRTDLSPQQLQYAANDVLYLVEMYHKLLEMINRRPTLSTGGEPLELHHKAQAVLPNLVELLIHGYGDEDHGWKTNLFSH